MKISMIALLTILSVTSGTVFSQPNKNHNIEKLQADSSHTKTANEKMICESTINIKVNGLVCDFCARSLEKVFSKKGTVKDIHIDLSKGKIQVIPKVGITLDNDTITKMVTDSGYNVVSINKGC